MLLLFAYPVCSQFRHKWYYSEKKNIFFLIISHILRDQAFCFLSDLISYYSVFSSFLAPATLMNTSLFLNCTSSSAFVFAIFCAYVPLHLSLWLIFSSFHLFYNHFAVFSWSVYSNPSKHLTSYLPFPAMFFSWNLSTL